MPLSGGERAAPPDEVLSRTRVGALPVIRYAKETLVFRRRIAAPIRPKPPIIIIQDDGSGTAAAAKVSVPE